jgi:hypothetical protein
MTMNAATTKSRLIAIWTIAAAFLLFGLPMQAWPPCTIPTGGDYEVRITLVGINLLVHSQDPDTATGPAPITVMIPNEENGRPKFGTADPHDVPSHFPYILASKATLQSAANPGITFIPAHNHPAEFHYYFLKGEQIQIDDLATPPELDPSICYSVEPVGECPTSLENAKSLRWFPSVREMKGGGTQTPNPPHFAVPPDGKTISARLVITKGTVQACLSSPVKWHIRTKESSDGTLIKKQVLPHEVRWYLRGVGKEFKLTLSAFDGTFTRQLVFKPDTNNKIDIVIGNNPEDEIGPTDLPIKIPALDPHFPLYYEFIYGNTTGDGPIPFSMKQELCPNLYFCDPQTSALYAPPVPAVGGAVTHSGHPVPSGLNCSSTRWP